jgi:hypothetical protein
MNVSDELVSTIADLLTESPDILNEDELSRISGSPEMILKNLLRQMDTITDISYAVKSYNAALKTAKATWAYTDPRDKTRIKGLFDQAAKAIQAKKNASPPDATNSPLGGRQKYDSATVSDYGDKIIQGKK